MYTEQLDEIYRNIRDILSSDILLTFPDFSLPFMVGTDASKYGIGAILYQQVGSQTKYISFPARALHSGEKNYGATKRELLAIIYALQTFNNYLFGVHFTLNTDHHALLFIFTQKHTNPMINTWLETLLSFDFTIVHRPGILNVLPDRISRFYDADDEETKDAEMFWNVDFVDKSEVLHSRLFESLQIHFGRCEFDMFASASNHQLPVYFTKEVDAMKELWSKERLWIFPPTELLPKVLRKIVKDQTKATLVTPLLPQEPWFVIATSIADHRGSLYRSYRRFSSMIAIGLLTSLNWLYGV